MARAPKNSTASRGSGSFEGVTPPKKKLNRTSPELADPESVIDSMFPAPVSAEYSTPSGTEARIPLLPELVAPPDPMPPAEFAEIVAEEKAKATFVAKSAEPVNPVESPSAIKQNYRENLARERLTWGTALSVSWLITIVAVLRVLGWL
jgi:hypothetical protein